MYTLVVGLDLKKKKKRNTCNFNSWKRVMRVFFNFTFHTNELSGGECEIPSIFFSI